MKKNRPETVAMFKNMDELRQKAKQKADFDMYGEDEKEWTGKWERSHLLVRQHGTKEWIAVAAIMRTCTGYEVIDKNDWHYDEVKTQSEAERVAMQACRALFGLRTSKFERYLRHE